MLNALRVADECGEKYMPVTYDLAIAKPALQIQSSQKPKFDRLFIMFGPFHTKSAYFRALGYMLEGSGGDHVLVESGVLALGSLNGFLKGTFYNRCKRLHVMLAAALREKHMEAFIKYSGFNDDHLVQKCEDLFSEHTPENLSNFESSEEVQLFMSQYERFVNETLDTKHGTTAKFWLQYCEYVEIYLMFCRAVKSNDLSLFIYSLEQMIPLFVAAGLHNYAKWITLYNLNLINMDHSHPGLKEILNQGAMTIGRTQQAFARNDIDLTLEQTVNLDAASRLTGIASLKQNISARRRWNYSDRSEVL